MLINSATDKVFKDTDGSEITQQDHVTKEELPDTAHEATSSTLPTIFSLAAEKSKKIEEPIFEDVVATCRAQMDKPLPDRYPPIAYAVKIGRHDVVKFLIDAGESVNATTPAVPVDRGRAGTESGRSPLEIAVKQQDVEMVRILTTYHRENRAAPEISYQRFAIAYFGSSEGCYWSNNGKSEQSSPLLDAFKLGNQEIVDLIIKAHTDPKRLCADFTAVQYTKNSTIMRLWIEQNFLLLKGKQKHVADSTVEMFMNKKDLNVSDVETLLEFGWRQEVEPILIAELEQALISNDAEAIQLVIADPRMEEQPLLLLARYNRADLAIRLIERGDVPERLHLETAIKHGSLDAVRLFIEHGVSYEDGLALAVDHKQWEVARYFASSSKDFYGLVELCRNQSNAPLRDRYPPVAFAVQLGRHDVVTFLLNHRESVNAATPDVPVWWDVELSIYIRDLFPRTERAGLQQGYSPLELAITQQDVKMVKILIEHGAVPEISYHRFATVWAYGESDYKTCDKERTIRHLEDPSSLLSDALKLGNQEIIDLVIKAYSNPERLYAEYATIQASKNPDAMRSWLEQNIFLWNGELKQVSDAVVALFMENRQGLQVNPSEVAILLQHGWSVTRQEFEQAVIANDPQIVRLLADHSRLQESPFVLLAQYNRVDAIKYLIKKDTLPAREHLDIAIKHGSLESVQALLATRMAFDGALLLAVQHKQKAIVEYLLDFPIDAQEMKKAQAAAYDIQAYDIMELLEKNT